MWLWPHILPLDSTVCDGVYFLVKDCEQTAAVEMRSEAKGVARFVANVALNHSERESAEGETRRRSVIIGSLGESDLVDAGFGRYRGEREHEGAKLTPNTGVER
ncbi:hypothetical protein CYLTODRAFT_415414 [Cylindrobasidium torrendii FP15055 ss-10]|uniref:Uncharacterized protein n=1 Tax=Cylindrobasidium torrendii FP15055 ss-10 TaxID=1314674 RepID=A0A0D7ATC7_9AGAR|nr:hypothetical protein CYLTODRAFT_415414 [Cylindrobasidium torrendii FP15055 ss-10]